MRRLAVLTMVLVGFASGTDGRASALSAPEPVVRITLESEVVGPGVRDVTAHAFTSAGAEISGADLDVGALTDDPDLRVTTTPMRAVNGQPSAYRARVTFPVKGDWVIVVRSHAPSQNVELFTEAITDAAARPSGHDANSNPSMRAVLRNDPTFYDRYNPYGATGSTRSVAAAPAALGHGAPMSARPAARSGFDFATAAMALLHTLGAVAWIGSVLGLVLANRVGPGSARSDIADFIADRYLLLAAGGLALVTLSGLTLVRQGSAGLTDLRGLFATNLGVAYAAVFAAKLVLVGFSVVTTWRIASAMAVWPIRSRTARVASVGAMGDNGPTPRTLALAERNLILGAMIIVCVVVLGQLHHALQ